MIHRLFKKGKELTWETYGVFLILRWVGKAMPYKLLRASRVTNFYLKSYPTFIGLRRGFGG